MDKKYKILIVDDMPKNIQLAANILKNENVEISFTQNGFTAIEKSKKEKFDLILLDIMMPEISGYEVCERLKQDPLTKDIPVIFLTAKNDEESIVKGFDIGAVDYVTKPFNNKELNSRVFTHIQFGRAKFEIEEYAKTLSKKNKELEKLNKLLKENMKKLETMSHTDSLTGLFNRRYILEKIVMETARYKRSKKPYSIIMGDIDFFKSFNDKHGHECGDYILVSISSILTKNARECDLVSRWGGEEFLILLPETDIDGAFLLAERIRSEIEMTAFDFKGITKLHAKMTFGISQYKDGFAVDKVIDNADQALYKGKSNGRNRVESDVVISNDS